MHTKYLWLILIIGYGTVAFGQHNQLFPDLQACYEEHRQLLTRVEALERSTVQLQNHVIQLETNAEPVAFQVHLSADQALYSNSATIKFDNVFLITAVGTTQQQESSRVYVMAFTALHEPSQYHHGKCATPCSLLIQNRL